MICLVEVIRTEPPTKFLWWTSEEWLWRAYPSAASDASPEALQQMYEANDYYVGTAGSREEALADARAIVVARTSEEELRESTREVVEVTL